MLRVASTARAHALPVGQLARWLPLLPDCPRLFRALSCLSSRHQLYKCPSLMPRDVPLPRSYITSSTVVDLHLG